MKKLVSLLLCLFVFAALAIPAAASDEIELLPVSSDIPEGEAVEVFDYADLDADWYREAAEKYGYPDIFGESVNFEPEKEITRIEFVQLLHRALGISIKYFAAPDITEHFDDMDNEDLGASELYDLVSAGIIKSGGSFDPTRPLTREVMVHWTIAALDYVTGGDYAIILIMPEPFDDDDQISEEYKNDVVKAVILGIIKGRGDNMLYPKAAATRAEAVTVVKRLVDIADSLTKGVRISAFAKEIDGALEMSLTIFNNTDNDVIINHSSGQKYDFKVFDADGEIIYTWSADKLFIEMLTATEIAAGESVTFTETLSADEYAAIKEKAVELRAYVVGTADFFIDENGYPAPIA